METVAFKANFAIGAFKVPHSVGNVYGLVVEHHAENIETRLAVREFEVPGFVNEYAQHLYVHAIKKREWRDKSPATHAESFPRIPVTLSALRRSVGIVAHLRTVRKGGR